MEVRVGSPVAGRFCTNLDQVSHPSIDEVLPARHSSSSRKYNEPPAESSSSGNLQSVGGISCTMTDDRKIDNEIDR